jgi:hypothetical protein
MLQKVGVVAPFMTDPILPKIIWALSITNPSII